MEKNCEVPLPSKSALRIGPMYAMFLLPKEGIQPPGHAPAAAAAAAAAVAGLGAGSKPPAPRAKATVPYAHVVEHVYSKHFAAFPAFTVHDMARLALVEFPASHLQEDVEKLRSTLVRAVTRSCEYEALPADRVPHAAVAAFGAGHAGKKVTWYKRLSPEAAAAKREALRASTAAAAAAGAGGGEDEAMVVE